MFCRESNNLWTIHRTTITTQRREHCPKQTGLFGESYFIEAPSFQGTEALFVTIGVKKPECRGNTAEYGVSILRRKTHADHFGGTF
jgi:hypothetical protein